LIALARQARRRAIAAVVVLPLTAHAHVEAESSTGWAWDPSILIPMAVLAVLYSIGTTKLRLRSHGGLRRLHTRACLFASGWIALIGALCSPLHAWAMRSFTAHMVEHELLMLVAAPLLVLSQPLAVLLWALPARTRLAVGRGVRSAWVARPWRVLTAPVSATLLQAAVLWFWHAPSLFDRALRSDVWHAAQHACFIASSLFFWHAVAVGHGAVARERRGLSAFCLFVTSIVSGALGALMAFSNSPWYAGYASLGVMPFGLTPAEDQQLAGLVMWIPGGLVHAVVALVLVRSLLSTTTPTGPVRHAVES